MLDEYHAGKDRERRVALDLRAWDNNSTADSRFAPSQCETSLQSNGVSHWLGANLESVLYWVGSLTRYNLLHLQYIPPMKTEYCHDAIFVVTGGSGQLSL